MKIYIITNGYIGDGLVTVLACAKNEERALELARKKFKEEFEKYPHYGEGYYSRLEVLDEFDNLDKEWVTGVLDY